MTCQKAEPIDEYGKCTCNTDCGESQLINSRGRCTICRMPQQDCKACGKIKSTNSCPGYSNGYTNFEEPHTERGEEDEYVIGFCYTNFEEPHTVRGEEEDDGHTQTTKDGRHQNTGPEDEQVKCTCYIDSQVNKYLINCKCQRTECCGMTCQDKEPLDEYVIGSCYTNFEEPHTSDDGHTQITKDGRHQPEDKQVKCTYYTDPQVKHGVRGEEEDDGYT